MRKGIKKMETENEKVVFCDSREQQEHRVTIELTHDLALAMLACVYAVLSNRKLRAATYMYDVRKRYYDKPQKIQFDTAADMLSEVASKVILGLEKGDKENVDGE